MEHFIPKPFPNEISFFMLSRLLKSKGVEEYLKAAELVNEASKDREKAARELQNAENERKLVKEKHRFTILPNFVAVFIIWNNFSFVNVPYSQNSGVKGTMFY